MWTIWSYRVVLEGWGESILIIMDREFPTLNAIQDKSIISHLYLSTFELIFWQIGL